MWRVASLLAFVAGIFSVIQYPGNKFVFCFFTLVVFGIAYLAVRWPSQYAHFFLGIAWFLGFWVKYLFHRTTGGEYYEMHGLFDGSDTSWDAAFLVIGVGGAGYLVGRLILVPFGEPAIKALSGLSIEVPAWYASFRSVIWLIVGLLVVAVLVINEELGLLVRGYVAQVILPWPLGGLFAWMTDIGIALLLALLLAWDRQSDFGVVRGFVALCIEGALVSVSTLSRGVYFFHTIPPLITEGGGEIRRGRLRHLVLLIVIWGLVGVAIPSTTTFLRLFGRNVIPNTTEELSRSRSVDIKRSMTQDITVSSMWDQFLTMTQILVVDRWTGLEGVMATIAYPEKSWDLFTKAALQRRSYGTVDIYTKMISGSTFTEENAKKYHFATLAGPIAFLYFSGSHMVVFLGMALISILMSAIELLWLWLVRDRLLVAMSGLYLALIVMQLSGELVQAVTGVIAVTGAFLLVWLVGYIVRSRGGGATEVQARKPSCSAF
jgi:hypothetical protein